jgi:toxin ParE1/3/4
VRVVWLRTALRNLDEAAAWIARDRPAAATRVVQRIRRATERLAEHPESGRPGRVAGTRELVVPGLPYILPYRVREDRVEILRVLHTARRWPERGRGS